MTHNLSRAFFTLSLIVFFAAYLEAQESAGVSPPENSAHRSGSLAGHEFVSSSFVEDPFVRTFLRTGLGFGITPEMQVPLLKVNGKTYYGEIGSLIYGVMDVEYQQAIRDWIAIRARLSVIGRMADGAQAIIAQGITLMSGFELGWRFRVAETERFSISGSAGVKNKGFTDVYLQRYIDGILENGEILPQNKIVQSTPLLLGTVGGEGAYALSDLTGLTVSASLDYGESADRNAGDKWYYSIAAMADFNFRHHGGTPVGFVVGGRTSLSPAGAGVANGTTQLLFGRIAYTGGADFALGLDLCYEWIPIRGLEKKQGFLSAVVDTRLFF
jgi:hypothetical protein